MNHDIQIKIQTYLDRELRDDESREIANLLARDREALALFSELKNTRQCLVGTEIGISLPESREFFWSKIERNIRAEQESQPAPESSFLPAFRAWRRFLIPAGAFAALILAGLITLSGGSSAPMVETAVADPGAFTYHDFSTGTTLVWFSYPADDEAGDEPSVSK